MNRHEQEQLPVSGVSGLDVHWRYACFSFWIVKSRETSCTQSWAVLKKGRGGDHIRQGLSGTTEKVLCNFHCVLKKGPNPPLPYPFVVCVLTNEGTGVDRQLKDGSAVIFVGGYMFSIVLMAPWQETCFTPYISFCRGIGFWNSGRQRAHSFWLWEGLDIERERRSEVVDAFVHNHH